MRYQLKIITSTSLLQQMGGIFVESQLVKPETTKIDFDKTMAPEIVELNNLKIIFSLTAIEETLLVVDGKLKRGFKLTVNIQKNAKICAITPQALNELVAATIFKRLNAAHKKWSVATIE